MVARTRRELKMKVAILTHFPDELDSPNGGVEAVNVILSTSLAKLSGISVHVVTLSSECKKVEVVSERGITIHRLPRGIGNELLNAIGGGRKTILAYLEELQPDLVHANDTYGIMSSDLPFPQVFTIHGFIYEDTLVSDGKFVWLRSKLWQWVETSGWARKKNIISISPYVREKLGGVFNGTIYDIENPISEDFFDVKREEKKGVIFSAAVISKRKNQLALIQAVEHLLNNGCDVELRLAGPIVEPDYGETVKKYIQKKGLNKRVILLGSLGRIAIMNELSQASLFALVSQEENSPMGIEEAMAVGLPIVTSNRCGMPYMVRNYETGFLVDPFDPKRISKAIMTILEDDLLSDSISKAAKKFAKEHYHPEKVAHRTMLTYKEILSLS